MDMSLLVVQPSSKCDNNCLICPWRDKFGCRGIMLPLKALEKLKAHLDEFRFDETLIICPNPLLHPKINIIISEIEEISRKIVLFLPIGVSRRLLSRKILERIDLVSLVIPSHNDLKNGIHTIKMLLSQGIDNLEAYIFLDSSYDFAEILSSIDICKKYGLKTVLGPKFYTYPCADKFIEEISKKENVEIGLHYGIKYFYDAIKLFIDNYPVTILTSPTGEECKTLYLNPYGNFSKCPPSGVEISYREITKGELRKMLFSSCVMNRETVSVFPRINVSLVTKEGVEIPSDILELLELISQVNSFRAACKALGVPPSTYWEKIQTLERKLGRSLIISIKGGRKKGITMLTEFAKEFLNKYREVREKVLVSIYEY